MNYFIKGIVPGKHQEKAIERMGYNFFFALFMEQGTGKTLCALAHILKLLLSGEIKNCLVVCPKPVIQGWFNDIQLFKPFFRSILLKHMTIINYDMVWRREEFFKNWDCIILDESHYIKNRTSRRSKFLLKCAKTAKYKYILTGTPIGNSHWEEIWSQYSFLHFSIFGKYSAFEKKYCVLNEYFKPCYYKNVDELKQIIYTHAYAVKKEDCLDLPDKLPPQRQYLELKEKAMYKQMLKNYIEELDLEAKNAVSRLVKLRQICSGHLKDADGKAHKIKCEKPTILKDFLENWNDKLVIFAEFKQSIKDIETVVKKLKRKYVVLDGNQKDKSIWQQFQNEKGIQVIICQYRTANAGINLYAASTIIFYEPTLSSQIFEQACDRIHRIGQKQKCSYILFETEKTVEKKIWDALMKHRDFNETEVMSLLKEEGRVFFPDHKSLTGKQLENVILRIDKELEKRKEVG
ncbi:DEAD/DEAH box helicase [Selenomonadales bacterium OttesenSCG-928-I06]|nr:DEAD/DEAH box helicase [Selenomonadales bacterium OttesenSCG-928-I06]